MLDKKLLREQPEKIKAGLESRGSAVDFQGLLELDKKWRETTTRVENLQARKNETNESVARKKKNREDAAQEIDAMRQLGESIKILNAELEELESRFAKEWLNVPNLPHVSVPRGKDETANQVVRQWGNPGEYAFHVKPHWEIGESMGILDAARAVKISGARFLVYRGAGARLERALIQFMLDVHTRGGKYVEIFPPLLVNRASMIGTGQLPKMENDMFRTSEEELYLIPTAEVPVTNLHREETLKQSELPIFYAAYTPCFRREAGSYGKDTKGIVRQHQFNKVELVKIVEPESSYDQLENLVQDAEKILQLLNLPYRVVLLSTGDMSFASAKTYDLEVWHEGVKRYWEVSSCSNFEDFQARRAQIRFRDESGKVRLCHTLNGSGLATSRLLPAILENYQTEDGSVLIPEALIPYVDGKRKITPQGKWE